MVGELSHNAENVSLQHVMEGAFGKDQVPILTPFVCPIQLDPRASCILLKGRLRRRLWFPQATTKRLYYFFLCGGSKVVCLGCGLVAVMVGVRGLLFLLMPTFRLNCREGACMRQGRCRLLAIKGNQENQLLLILCTLAPLPPSLPPYQTGELYRRRKRVPFVSSCHTGNHREQLPHWQSS
jgi:hypothetical protein